MERLKEIATALTLFCMENGIHIDTNEDFINTSVLQVFVERRNRTDDEIDMLIRQLKVNFIFFTPIQDIRIRYKVV